MPRAFSRGVKSFFPLAYRFTGFRFQKTRDQSDQIRLVSVCIIILYIPSPTTGGVRRPNIPSGIFFFCVNWELTFNPILHKTSPFKQGFPNQLWTDPERSQKHSSRVTRLLPDRRSTFRLDRCIVRIHTSWDRTLRRSRSFEKNFGHRTPGGPNGKRHDWFFKIPPSEPTHPLGFIYKQPP